MTSNAKISHEDLLEEIEECAAIADFLQEAIGLILEEGTSYTDKLKVPFGAQLCLEGLSTKLKALLEKI